MKQSVNWARYPWVQSPPALTSILKLPKSCFNLGNMCLSGSNAMEGASQVEVNLATILGALLCIQLADNGFVTIAPLAYDVPYGLHISLR